MKKISNYIFYILEHKKNVLIEGRKLGLGFWQLLKHDFSKFSRDEFHQYKQNFFEKECSDCINYSISKNDTPFCKVGDLKTADKCKNFKRLPSHKITKDFQLAWLHHQHNNKHHWQYWIQITEEGRIVYEMPEKYALEMIADWNAMSRKFKQNTTDWYLARKNIILHEKTRKFVEDKLNILI